MSKEKKLTSKETDEINREVVKNVSSHIRNMCLECGAINVEPDHECEEEEAA